jgi:GT2 family glycosyltransferase
MIVFVVTNFNNSAFTSGLHESLLDTNPRFDFHLIVVDNGSNDREIKKLSDLLTCDTVTILKSPENLGYFRGLNLGIRYAKSKFSSADYILVGNNDLIFPVNFFNQLEQCKSVLEKYPVVSPNIRMLDGTPQNPHVIKGISKKREFIYDLYHSSYLLAGLIVRLAELTHRFTDRKDEQQHAVAQEIHQGYGACYVLTPKFFEHFDELWAPTFLMYEEYFLAKQLEDKGFKTYYEPRIMVTHHCHASTGTLPGKFRWQLSRDAHKEYRKYVKVWR